MYYKVKLFFALTNSFFLYLTSVTFAVSTSSSKSLTFTETDTLFPAFDSEKFPCVEWQLSFSDRNRRVTSFSRSGMVLTPRFEFLLVLLRANFVKVLPRISSIKYYNCVNPHKNPFTLLLTQTMKRDMWYSTLKSSARTLPSWCRPVRRWRCCRKHTPALQSCGSGRGYPRFLYGRSWCRCKS